MIECKKCGRCCTQHPCSPEPSELKEIAEYLNVTIEELIQKYLVFDYHCDTDDGNLYYMVFRREGDVPYTMVSWSWAFSSIPCIFLQEDNTCAIHPVKPVQARLSYCRECRMNSNDELPKAPGKLENVLSWKSFIIDDGCYSPAVDFTKLNER